MRLVDTIIEQLDQRGYTGTIAMDGHEYEGAAYQVGRDDSDSLIVPPSITGDTLRTLMSAWVQSHPARFYYAFRFEEDEEPGDGVIYKKGTIALCRVDVLEDFAQALALGIRRGSESIAWVDTINKEKALFVLQQVSDQAFDAIEESGMGHHIGPGLFATPVSGDDELGQRLRTDARKSVAAAHDAGRLIVSGDPKHGVEEPKDRGATKAGRELTQVKSPYQA